MNLFRKLIRRLLRLPHQLIHIAANTPFIRESLMQRRNRMVSYRRGLKKLSGNKPNSFTQSFISNGFISTDLATLEYDEAPIILEAASAIFDAMENSNLLSLPSFSLPSLVKENPSLLKHYEILFRCGLNFKFLNIVEDYLETPVAYGGLDVFYTKADSGERGARIWHRDGEDISVIKVAIYINDVGEDGGPLEVLHIHSERADRSLQRPYNDAKIRGKLKQHLTSFDITSFTGEAGTTIFCDTARLYHRGRPASKPRKAIFFNYYPCAPLHPYFCPPPPFSSSKIAELTKNLDVMQQNSAQWRENLPRLIKILVPRAPFL